MRVLKSELGRLSGTLDNRMGTLEEIIDDLDNAPHITEQASDDQDNDDAPEEQEYEPLEELVQTALEDSRNISKRLDRLKGSTAAKLKKLRNLQFAFVKAQIEVNKRITSLEEKIAILSPPKVEKKLAGTEILRGGTGRCCRARRPGR